MKNQENLKELSNRVKSLEIQIQNLFKAKKKLTWEVGETISLLENEEYVIFHVIDDLITLVGKEDFLRWNDPIRVGNIAAISKEEMRRLIDDDERFEWMLKRYEL